MSARRHFAGRLAAVATLGLAFAACKGSPTEEGAAQAAPGTQGMKAPAATPSGTAASASVAGSGAAPGAPAPGAVKSGPPGPLNVILLSIDSLRQDMPWAGYARPIAPNLTKLAAESVVYTHAYSVSSYTAKSVAAFLSSQYPSSLYRSAPFFTAYPKSNQFIQEVLGEHGVRTMAVHAHAYFRSNQLDQGFDVWEVVPGITFDAETDKNVTSDKTTDIAIRTLGAPEALQKPFFAWLHYMDPHDVYVKHAESPDFGKTNRDRYDSEVFFTDLHVGRFLDWARKQPFWANTAVIVTADHGEAFGEHGLYKHAFWLWDVVTRVPVLVHAPGVKPHRIDLNRSHLDLAPTIAELAGVKGAVPGFVGKSLVPELYETAPPEIRDPIVLDLPADSHNPEIRALVRGNKKLISYGKTRFELYDLENDPGELRDLAKSDPETLADLKAELTRVNESIPYVAPYGGTKLSNGKMANGQTGPAK